MKKKTVVTRQITKVDDVTGAILEQKTEQVIETDSEEEEGEIVTHESQAVEVRRSRRPNGTMIMNDDRTGKTYKVAIRNN